MFSVSAPMICARPACHSFWTYFSQGFSIVTYPVCTPMVQWRLIQINWKSHSYPYYGYRILSQTNSVWFSEFITRAFSLLNSVPSSAQHLVRAPVPWVPGAHTGAQVTSLYLVFSSVLVSMGKNYLGINSERRHAFKNTLRTVKGQWVKSWYFTS